MTSDTLKRRAAERAVGLVRPGMKLGLGSGSTAAHFVDYVGARVAAGLDIVCVATSQRTHDQAASLGIRLAALDDYPSLDLTVDGADEVDGRLRLIKGGGGALLREKIVAAASSRMVVIVDASKEVTTLGKFPLPVEIVPFGMQATRAHILRAAAACGLVGELRLRLDRDGHAFVTDGGHQIIDCAFGPIGDPDGLADRLDAIPGVVEHGLFVGFASTCIVADPLGVRVVGEPISP